MTTEGYYTIIRTTEYYGPRTERAIVRDEQGCNELIMTRDEAEAWIEDAEECTECRHGASSPDTYHLSRYTSDDLDGCEDEADVEAMLSVEY